MIKFLAPAGHRTGYSYWCDSATSKKCPLRAGGRRGQFDDNLGEASNILILADEAGKGLHQRAALGRSEVAICSAAVAIGSRGKGSVTSYP